MESTPPHLQSQPAKKDTPVPPDQDQQMELHPIPENHHPVPTLQRSDLSKPKPPAPLPSPHNEDVHLNTGSSPPTEADGPPPLPDRSPLSQEVQHSVMKPSPTPKEPPLSPAPYEIPEPYEIPLDSRAKDVPLCTQHVHCNECYETQQQEALDRTAVDDAVATPINTELYIHVDPMLQPQQRKPKPPRPPPPSKSAIRRAQQRKANRMASSRPAVKSLAVKTITQQTSEYEVMDGDDFAHRPANYEDIDAGNSFSPAPPSLPPPLPAANQSRKFGSEPHRGTTPTRPPTQPPTLPHSTLHSTLHSTAPTNKARQRPRSTPVPSGFTCSVTGIYRI